MNTSEVTLLGILYTDGCLSPKGKKGWRLYLSNTSWQIILAFKSSLMQIFDLPEKRIRITKKMVNDKPFYKAVVDSAEIGGILTKKYGSFRTLKYVSGIYPPASLPRDLFKDSKAACHFLKVAFSCDGGINLYVAHGKYSWLIRNVYLSCHHPVLIRQYHDLLENNGVNNKILKRDNLIRIQGRVNLESFARRVGFLDNVKITQSSTYWQGFDKQHVLHLALTSYGNPSKIIKLPQFRVKI